MREKFIVINGQVKSRQNQRPKFQYFNQLDLINKQMGDLKKKQVRDMLIYKANQAMDPHVMDPIWNIITHSIKGLWEMIKGIQYRINY